MNRFDWQVLEALGVYLTSNEESRAEDLDILYTGQQRFGESWGGERKWAKKYAYVPLINLSLGRLVRAGLVNKQEVGGCSYSNWGLTQAGLALATVMVGHE